MLLSDFGIDEQFLAHTLKDKPSETLIEHSELTFVYYKKILSVKNLDSLLYALIKAIDKENVKLIQEMFESAVLLHDVGKINPYFQAKKMNNPLFSKYKDKTNSSDHSLLSSEKYLDYFLPKVLEIEDRKQREKLKFILYSFSYHISKHHGRLSVFESYRDEEDNVQSYIKHLQKLDISYFEFYILNKLLFSLLVSSDYYATTEYMADFEIDDFGLFDDKSKKLLKTKFDNFLTKFGKPKGINRLRNEIFKEAEKNLLENLDKHIYYLEAPTGSGKTITSINLALQLLNHDENLNKLFYIFPFNTLVEQTKGVFDEIFSDDLKIETINSISPIEVKKDQEDEESNYTASYVNRLFFHSPAIITTHVSLFNILFGTSKEDNFPLWQLANSVIILDEIQSYNNDLWWYMVEFFDKYAKVLNMKIIIMSATLPKLDYFLEKKDNFVDLISSKKREEFFTSHYFKDRVEVDFSLLDEGVIELERLEEFFDEKKEGYKKILFEFIKKQSAREFYNLLKESYEDVYELSGDDNKAYRQYVINKTKEDKPIIIVATQVIEAGVDIDMDLGFKDISTLDSEEQFMGRINRSCKKENSKVYFFNMDDVAKIYRGDNRLGFDLTKEKYQTILANKNFHDYYDEVLEVIQNNGDRYDRGIVTNIDRFNSMLQKLDYKEISKLMTLISSENFTLYFPFSIDIAIYDGVKEFKDEKIQKYLTNNQLDGLKVWNAYLELRDIEGFAKMKVSSSYINSLMQFFTFNIIKFQGQNKPSYGEEIGGFYFINDWESFIDEDGKFDRVAYQEKSNSLFL
jgi:CRISPR-associated endonuclease/helicase Cas3